MPRIAATPAEVAADLKSILDAQWSRALERKMDVYANGQGLTRSHAIFCLRDGQGASGKRWSIPSLREDDLLKLAGYQEIPATTKGGRSARYVLINIEWDNDQKRRLRAQGVEAA